MNRKYKQKNEAGVSLLETIIAIFLLTTLSLMVFSSLLSGTQIYGNRLQAYDDLSDVYTQIEGGATIQQIPLEGSITFKYNEGSQAVKVDGKYIYGISEEGDQVVLAEFKPEHKADTKK